MRRPSRVLFTWLTALALVVGACSKSVEGESKKWDSNSAKITELAAQYPGFKPALEARKQSAQKLREAADGLADDAKIEKLSAANTALMTGFVRELDDIDDKMKKLRESRVEAASQADDSGSQLGAKVAAEDAQKALDRADATLKTGAADEAGAAAVLKKIASDLDAAQAAVDKVLEVTKRKKDDAAASKQAGDDAKKAADAAAEAKVTPWKCEYCGSQNPHDEASCKSCGAARAGGDKKAEPPATK